MLVSKIDLKSKSYYKKLLKFTLKENEIIKQLKIPYEAFLPLLLSIKVGGNWSLKTDSLNVMAIKEKITNYNDKKKLGYTLENVYLFLNPVINYQEGLVYRLEKCGNKDQREIHKRPYKLEIDAEYLIKAVLNPITKKITLRKMPGPLMFSGSNSYGISHEMEHLLGEKIDGEPLHEFEYIFESQNKL
jgi:predicted metalloprotease